MPFLVCACCEEFLFTRNPLISRRCDTTIYYSPEDWLPKDVPLLTDLRTMPPLEDDTVRQCKAWWYADQQIRTEDMTRFVNVPDCEEGYPLLKSELPPGNLMEQHADHPKVYWPTEEPRITLGYLNFMYSKLVRILKTTTDIVYRQKAVQWCVEMLCTPDSRVRCILAGASSFMYSPAFSRNGADRGGHVFETGAHHVFQICFSLNRSLGCVGGPQMH